jgi:hypothetical protein
MSITLDGVQNTLDAMLRYWRGGTRWHRGSLDDGRGNKCIVGAVSAVRATSSNGEAWVPGEEIDAARHFIEMAVRERNGGRGDGFFSFGVIQTFNDSRRDYAEIEAVIHRAKQLAAAAYHAEQRRAQAVPMIEFQPSYARPALAPPAAIPSPSYFGGLRPAPVVTAAPLELHRRAARLLGG